MRRGAVRRWRRGLLWLCDGGACCGGAEAARLRDVRAIRATEVFMHRQLFKNSWGQYQMDCSDSAVREVHSLPKSQFNQPSLAGVLERIAAKYKLVVATLQPDKK